MTNTDPLQHQQAERQFITHVQAMLKNGAFRIDTTRGLKSVAAFSHQITSDDGGVALKRQMVDLGKTDRELEAKMPHGQTLSVALSARKWGLFKSPVARLTVVCMAPTKALLSGTAIESVSAEALRAQLAKIETAPAPTTVIVVSTAGFTTAAHELIDRRSDRTIILAQPNDAGGWSVVGPPALKLSVDQLNPETEADKKARLADEIKALHLDLMSGGISADKIASRTQLPLQWVEGELKNYARAGAGLAARRLDGKVVLFREGSSPAGKASGGLDMPFIDSFKTLFSRKGETEKKIALLSERRAALSQSRDAAYEDLAAMETNETTLKEQFKSAASESTKRRLTSQLLQARKDLARKQQLMSVLNQQIDVVSTHLHALELVHQGKAAKLPSGEDLTKDAEAAEEMLADLQADRELAGSIAPTGTASLTDEEQALYDELQAEIANPAAESTDAKVRATPTPATPTKLPEPPQRERQREAT